MKFLVLQHINIEHPGIFLKFMKEDNISLDTIELDENEKIPDLSKFGIFSFSSNSMVSIEILSSFMNFKNIPGCSIFMCCSTKNFI